VNSTALSLRESFPKLPLSSSDEELSLVAAYENLRDHALPLRHSWDLSLLVETVAAAAAAEVGKNRCLVRMKRKMHMTPQTSLSPS